MKVKIELEKTIQVRQFEPLRVMLSAEDDVADADAIKTLYGEISGKLKAILVREFERYDELSSYSVPARSTPAGTGLPKKASKAKVISAEY